MLGVSPHDSCEQGMSSTSLQHDPPTTPGLTTAPTLPVRERPNTPNEVTLGTAVGGDLQGVTAHNFHKIAKGAENRVQRVVIDN